MSDVQTTLEGFTPEPGEAPAPQDPPPRAELPRKNPMEVAFKGAHEADGQKPPGLGPGSPVWSRAAHLLDERITALWDAKHVWEATHGRPFRLTPVQAHVAALNAYALDTGELGLVMRHWRYQALREWRRCWEDQGKPLPAWAHFGKSQ